VACQQFAAAVPPPQHPAGLLPRPPQLRSPAELQHSPVGLQYHPEPAVQEQQAGPKELCLPHRTTHTSEPNAEDTWPFGRTGTGLQPKKIKTVTHMKTNKIFQGS